MTQYRIVSAFTLNQLETMVNMELAHGWIVTGGLIGYSERRMENGVLIDRHQSVFAQALIKHNDKHTEWSKPK